MRNCRGEKGQGREGASAVSNARPISFPSPLRKGRGTKGEGRDVSSECRAPHPLFSFSPLLLFLLLATFVAHAHGPYDSSAQLVILTDALELNATLGMDGAKQVLLNGGLSDSEAASALTVRGPSTFHDLSADLAPRFFEITSGGQVLKPKRLQVITDGLEASFTATYAAAASGDLEVRAHYFDGVEGMKPGAFLAMDENHNVKASAMFSRAKSATTVKLSAPAAVESPKVPALAATATNVVTSTQPTPAAPPPPPSSTHWWAVGLLAVVVVVLILARKISRAR